MGLTLQHPWALWLLLMVPAFIALAWRLKALETQVGRVSTGLRAVFVTVLVLALSGLAWLEEHEALSVVFLVDGSASIGAPGESATGGSKQARRFIQDALKARREGDPWGVVVFGAEPEVERLVRDSDDPPAWSARPESGGTDIEAALRLAMASFPPDTHRRVVLLSDGVETQGQALQQAIIARELDVPVDVITLPTTRSGPDVVAEALTSPANAELGRPFELRLQVRSPAEQDAKLRLYQGDALLGETQVRLKAGLDVITLPQTLTEPGLHRFRAVLESDPDTEKRNNEARTTVQIGGQPRVLLLEGTRKGADQLAETLKRAGFDVEVGGPGATPINLEEMALYDTIVLSDVNAPDLTTTQLQALERMVTHLGRGLVMLGGDRSFGLGGYYKTPVERTLPVKMTRQAQAQMPSQGITLAIDRSGSMGGFYNGGASKMNLAKEASVAVVELLNAHDELGVLGFDGAASWVSSYSLLSDKDLVVRRIGTMRAGGGTDIANALRAAHRGTRGGGARVKHVILLSDGMSNPSDIPAVVRQMREDKITLTTVAIGADSDRYTMERLAVLGGGRYYETEDAANIPQIFTRETMLSSKNFLVEKPFTPQRVEDSEVLRGIDALPPLEGYVATSLKPQATLALQTPDGDPLLAHWRRGLGRSLAFTSDAKARWASQWMADPALYGRFWTQALRWVSHTGAGDTLALATSLRGGQLTMTVDALNDEVWRDGAETQATVLHPDGRQEQVPLRQIAPGRYYAAVQAASEGTYYVSVVQRAEGRQLGQAVRELHRAWSPEFAPAHTGLPLLQTLASRTGGRFGLSPDALWLRPETPLTTPRPLTPWLVLALALLWLMDVAHRRFEGLLPSRTTARASQNAPALQQAPLADAPSFQASAVTQDNDDDDEARQGDAQGERQAQSDSKEPPSFTSRLLDAKRRSRKR